MVLCGSLGLALQTLNLFSFYSISLRNKDAQAQDYFRPPPASRQGCLRRLRVPEAGSKLGSNWVYLSTTVSLEATKGQALQSICGKKKTITFTFSCQALGKYVRGRTSEMSRHPE